MIPSLELEALVKRIYYSVTFFLQDLELFLQSPYKFACCNSGIRKDNDFFLGVIRLYNTTLMDSYRDLLLKARNRVVENPLCESRAAGLHFIQDSWKYYYSEYLKSRS